MHDRISQSLFFLILDQPMILDTGTSTDQVAGFGGSAKRCIGANIMTGKIAKNLELARAKFNN